MCIRDSPAPASIDSPARQSALIAASMQLRPCSQGRRLRVAIASRASRCATPSAEAPAPAWARC
eukprot:14245138-Alexandrium_andersonii.AAC.1